MAESKAAWDKVGEDFRILGRQLKQHYDQRPRPEGPGEPHDGPAGSGSGASPSDEAEEARVGREGSGEPGQAGPAGDRRKVDEALEKLRDSLEQAFSALGDAVRDPQVGEQTKKAASSLSDALTATFAEASERFRKK
jgi:hypothetical protein